VDDNNINLTVAFGYLSQHGIQADTADSGATALEMVQKKQYDLVFMDHMMPGMDGIETTQRIRALGKRHIETPIIALSANAILGARELFIEAGMNDFISKPINTRELNAILEKWLPAEKIYFSEVAIASAPVNALESDSRTVIDQNTGVAHFQNDKKLYLKILADFRREQSRTINEIRKLLAANTADASKVAHRLAHTLKSTAALIGAERLRQAAFAVEMTLAGSGSNGDTDSSLGTLETELRRVLAELEQLVPEQPQSASAAADKGQRLDKLDKEKVLALLATLEPLLRAGRAECPDLLEESGNMLSPLGAAYKEFAACVEDLDFPAALDKLPAIKQLVTDWQG
jgi:CheY-like chemotaxis protein